MRLRPGMVGQQVSLEFIATRRLFLVVLPPSQANVMRILIWKWIEASL
jgi:hypothetical protein